jgi:flavin reductase (DIM6/NTAB) family NADH-FMN oxidoreductase RutF
MTHRIDLDALAPRERYKLLCATVIPRPVAWVTTLDEDGSVNAAPFSFFNVFGQDPALLVLGLEHREGAPKDTTRNIRRTGEFVVNIATPDLLEAMVGTATPHPGSEVEALGLATEPSARVAPPRLAAAPASIECLRLDALSYSEEREIVVGRAVAMAARDGLIDPGTLRVDWGGTYPVARLFADRYAECREIAPMAIPPLPAARAPDGGDA